MPYAPMLLLLGSALLLAGPPLLFVIDARQDRVNLGTFKAMGFSALAGIAVLFSTQATIASAGG
ncbi:MAG: hypothetical protein OXE50_03845 [Chloroflexi bacterium]|nr:hypothetical protein [Chloroflexota bacterium]